MNKASSESLSAIVASAQSDNWPGLSHVATNLTTYREGQATAAALRCSCPRWESKRGSLSLQKEKIGGASGS